MANGQVSISEIARRARELAEQVASEPKQKEVIKNEIVSQTGLKKKDLNRQNLEGAQEIITQGQSTRARTPIDLDKQQRIAESVATMGGALSGQVARQAQAPQPEQRGISPEAIAVGTTALGAIFGGAEGGAVGAQVGLDTLNQAREEARSLEAAAKTKEEKEEARRFKLALFDQERADRKDLQDLKFEQEKQLAQLKSKSAFDVARIKDKQELERIAKKNALEKEKIQFKEDLAAKRKKTAQPKGTQFQAALFGKRIEQAESVFDDLSRSGFDPTSKRVAAERLLPELVKSENLKRQEQAERNFVNAVLRRESGAAIAQSEFDSAERQYFPRIGDSPAVLRQKKVNRLIALQGLKAEAGEAFNKIDVPAIQQQVAQQGGAPVQSGGGLPGAQTAVAGDDQQRQALIQAIRANRQARGMQ